MRFSSAHRFATAAIVTAAIAGSTLTSSGPSNAATIDGQSEGGGPVAAGSTTTLQVAGRGGTPGNARSVSLNLTATGADTSGFATVYPCDSPRPEASNLNFTSGTNVAIANSVLTRVSANGTVCIYTSARTNLIADVSGAFTTDIYNSFNPARLIDTRQAATSSGGNGLSIDESAIPAPATGFATSRITTAQYSPFFSDGVGAFRTNCYLSHMNFDDSLVFPGRV